MKKSRNAFRVSLCPDFPVVLSISKLSFLWWTAASLWLSKIGQVKRDSRASLIQFDRTAGCAEFDPLMKREQRCSCSPFKSSSCDCVVAIFVLS